MSSSGEKSSSPPAGQSSGAAQISVSAAEVSQFLATLKGYSDACADSRKAIEDKCEETSKIVQKYNALCEGHVNKVTSLVKEVRKHRADQRLDMDAIQTNVELIQSLADKASEKCSEVRVACNIVQNKESFLSSFVDIVKDTEALTRSQYTRTVYSATVTKEVCQTALGTLEAALRMLQIVHNLRNDDSKKKDGGETTADDAQRSIDVQLQQLMDDAVTMRRDVGNMDRMAKLLDDVNFLDQSMRVAYGEVKGVRLECVDKHQKKRKLEALVRKMMVYDVEKFSSVCEYDDAVLKETEKRMRVMDTDSSNILSATMSSLRRNGVTNPGDLPTEFLGSSSKNVPPTNDEKNRTAQNGGKKCQK